jgi:hypothetical protein
MIKRYCVPPPVVEAVSQNDFPKSQRLSAKSMYLWIQLPDIDPNKIIFVKGRFRDGFMCPHVVLDPGLSMSRPSAKTTNLLA